MTEEMSTTTEQTQAQPSKSYFSIFFGFLLFLMILASYVAIFWIWQQQQSQSEGFSQTLSKSLEGYQDDSQQSLAVAKQADERTVELQAKTLVLDEKISQAIAQQTEMQSLLRKMHEAKAENMISEVEKLVNLADQQLKFSGNLKSAMLALEAADIPLAQSGAPEFIDIREALGNDLQALKEFPAVDMGALSNQLESLMQLTGSLPLLQDQDGLSDHEQVAQNTPASESKPTIQENLWKTFQKFIMVEKIDSVAEPLVNVEQKFYLKENIKLRLLTARIALLQRNADVFDQDLAAVKDWMKQYYDLQHPNAEKALALIDTLKSTELGVALPSLQSSLDAIAQYQANKEVSQ